MAMPVLDLSYLTAVARIKIVNESRKSDHDLRHWVGHANFLDRLTRPSTIAQNQQQQQQFLQQQQQQQQQQQKVFQFALDSAAPTYTHTFSKGSDGRSSEPIIEVVEITDDDT